MNKIEILKKTIKSGNASAVVLPKSWLNMNVRVELIERDEGVILQEVLDIAKPRMSLSGIIGIYLVGSHAREDNDEDSDIDILIISENTNKEVIKVGRYEILIVSLDLLEYKLSENLLPIGPMLKEAKPLLNGLLLKKINVVVTKKNIRWYIETTKDRLKTIKESISTIKEKKPDGKLSDAVAYSLVLRLRTLYMINCLIENKKYNKDKFVKLIEEISGSSIAYARYVYSKNNKESQRHLPVGEAERLYDYLNNYLKETIKSIKHAG